MKSEPIIQERARPKGERHRSSWHTLLVVLLVLAALVVVPFLILRPRVDVYTLRSYETAMVQSGTLVEYVRGPGRLVPRLERSLLAPGEGIMADWLVAEGEMVEAGQLLGRVDSTELERAVIEAEQALLSAERQIEELRIETNMAEREEARALEEAETALMEARDKLATMQALFEVGAASAQELQAAQNAVTEAEGALADARADGEAAAQTRVLAMADAEAALAQAQVELELARARAAGLQLRAPIDGLLIALGAAVGERVDGGQVLATVASSTDLRVEATLSEVQAQGVSVGQRANISIAGQDYAGVVAQVSSQTEASADGGAIVPITLNFEEPPQGLRVGASANVEIEIGRKEDTLYLPRGPYLTTGGERLAYVVNGETATRHTVIFGLIDGNRVEVRDGLFEGQEVITGSYEAFKEREEIQLAPGGEIE